MTASTGQKRPRMTQTCKEALTELLAKVEAGDISDTGVDRFSAIPKRGGGVYSDLNCCAAKGAYWRGSLDAAKELHEDLLPRHYAQIHMWPVPEMSRVDIGGGHTGRDDSPARAWLIAILKALIAQEPDT